MTIHPTPTPHVHGCPQHPLGEVGVSPVACSTGAATHVLAWHTAIDPFVAQATATGLAVDVPAATLAQISTL